MPIQKPEDNPLYKQAIAMLRSDFHEKVRALNVAFGVTEDDEKIIIQKTGFLISDGNNTARFKEHINHQQNKNISLSDALKNAIEEMPSDFTVKEITNVIHGKYIKDAQQSSISAMLSKWGNDEQIIKVIEPGSGKRGTKYGRIGV